jgi:hypothetical protein
MKRTVLLIFVFASVMVGGAWWTWARASAAAAPPYDRKIDEYGNIRFDDEKARLDNVTIELQNDPRARLYLTCYGGRVGREGEAARIVTVDGGYREDLTVELWIIPPGMTPPQPSPTVEPREVRFVKGKVKRRAGRR